jgi:N-acetylglucosaminyldiphosphoundecaprenol N-acetyl-beta-D-mannosaminyltransferase
MRCSGGWGAVVGGRSPEGDSTLLFGISVTGMDADQFAGEVCALVGHGRKGKVFYANAHVLNMAWRCPRLRTILAGGSLVLCDGYGAVLASVIQRHRINQRLSGPDWLDRMGEEAGKHSLKLFLLGDEEGVADRAARVMEARHSGLAVTGVHHGFFSKQGPENDEVVNMVNRAAPDILLVGMGTPVQEFWIGTNLGRLNAGVCIAVGAAFRWYSGTEKRAPRWMRDHGLEWVGRLARHPVRYFGRYVVGNPLFLWRVLKERFGRACPDSLCSRPLWARCSEGCALISSSTQARLL